MTSRRALTLALAIPALLLAHATSAQISDDVVKLGVLTDLSGPTSDATGQGSVTAAEMAVADFGSKLAGKPIEVISANHQLKADIGAQTGAAGIDVSRTGVELSRVLPCSPTRTGSRRSVIR